MKRYVVAQTVPKEFVTYQAVPSPVIGEVALTVLQTWAYVEKIQVIVGGAVRPVTLAEESVIQTALIARYLSKIA